MLCTRDQRLEYHPGFLGTKITYTSGTRGLLPEYTVCPDELVEFANVDGEWVVVVLGDGTVSLDSTTRCFEVEELTAGRIRVSSTPVAPPVG